MSDIVDKDPYVVNDTSGGEYMYNDLYVNDQLNNNIPIHRFSEDNNAINNSGFRIIEMCKSIGLSIVNSRCGIDAYGGRNTCNNRRFT